MNFLKKGQQILEKHNLWEFTKYTFFGAGTTLVNLGVYFICLHFFKWHYLVGTVLSWFASVLFAFATNKRWVFKSKTETKMAWLIEFGRFLFYRLLSLGIDAGFMILFIDFLKMNESIAKLLVQILVVAANYLFSKFLIFNKEKSRKNIQ